ncbi:regulator of chromosome condensation 1/beta-lactamase-inhibitor protein II [Scheffersomyces coipomensis]|uniref:regulator of chromosome condensation 1/beta-lactamase-inhibitor protein II n=1 Tax=Scheffersomyces coipomensis TaxID=1788519 RepID=UPI00315D947E
MTYTLLACGSNGNYQLGINNDIDQNTLQPCLFELPHNNKPTSILTKSKPIKISCGGNHTLILFDNGDIYSCGDNSFGQCGHPLSQSSYPVFTKIGTQSNWKDISCGWEFSMLINRDNQVYVCGRGLKGELGLGNKITQSELCLLGLDFDIEEIVDVKSSLDATILRIQNNQLLGWGNCRKGQLGKQLIMSNNKPEPIIWNPRKLDFGLEAATNFQFSLGREFSVFYLGGGVKIHGKSIGLEQASVSNNLSEVIDIKTMWSSVHQIVRDKLNHLQIESYGNNSHGQLFPEVQSESITDIVNYAIGSEHGLISTPDSIVYSWGWGEHGNCGIQQQTKDAEDVTFDYLNLLYKAGNDEKIILLSGGCATSWILIETST